MLAGFVRAAGNSCRSPWRLGLSLCVLSSVPAIPCRAAAAPPAEIQQKVLQASLATYIHGMTEEIALQEVGNDGLPVVRRLLQDPQFPRRDNLVAFLDALGGAEDREAVLAFLRQPPGSLARPEEERALLNSPQALGRMARRGDRGSLAALLAMTGHHGSGGVLERAAGAAGEHEAFRDDLLEMALRGLALSQSPEARERLRAVAGGTVVPAATGRSLKHPAADALALFDGMARGTAAAGMTLPAPLNEEMSTGSAGEDGQASTPTPDAAGDLDAQTRTGDAGLTYANHVAVTDPMADSRLDTILDRASLRGGRGDFVGDVACCATVSRSGSAKSFGSATDGLDVVDTDAEMRSVLSNTAARFHVVRAINYCGSTGSNIIGCAWQPGNGAMVVRMSNLDSEAILWLHEYGHNTGLPHSSAATRYIMYGVDYGTNDGLSQSDCDAYHAPNSRAAMTPVDIGACTDGDADMVHTVVDNCPSTPNADQTDTNANGIGDVCDSGGGPVCGNGAVETGESCDGADLAGQSCVTRGFGGGTLGCSATCTFDTSGCTSLCGNGVKDAGEACDGADLGGQSCQGLGYDGGSLQCTASCTLDKTGCSCTDGDRDGVARCDGDCNDNNPTVYPGAPEICNDGIDQDCSGRDKTKGCATENCRNGVDDDRDGRIDCADPDCSRNRACR